LVRVVPGFDMLCQVSPVQFKLFHAILGYDSLGELRLVMIF